MPFRGLRLIRTVGGHDRGFTAENKESNVEPRNTPNTRKRKAILLWFCSRISRGSRLNSQTMNPKIILCLALVLSRGSSGCSTAAHRSAPPITPEQNAANALSTLHVGMTIGDADHNLGRYGAIRAFTVSSAMRHSYRYHFIPNMNAVTLQFDEHDKLVSWEAAKNDPK
jgi:hypothetical protein